MRKIPAALAAAALGAVLLLGGCRSSSDAGAAQGAVASATANPTVQAELDQGRALVASCFPGTLLQQVRTIHLVFLSSASGKNGPAVTAARDKVLGCLHIADPARRQAFVSDAGEAALHGHLGMHAGRVTYFEVTLPKLVLKYGGTAAGMGTSTAQPSIPGTTAEPSPAPSTFSPAVTGSAG
jgi:hypothetical protein